MLVGVPKEVKTHEYRVGLTPGSVRELAHRGHEMIVKVKEPQPHEVAALRPDQILFTYLHLAADRGLARQLVGRLVSKHPP